MRSKGERGERELLGGIEAGGTKFVCGVGRGCGEILGETTIPTSHPEETIEAVKRFFEEARGVHGEISAVGIGSFGPVEVRDPAGERYGTITTTPKEGWGDFPLLRSVSEALGGGIPAGLDTDVNAAALGEWRLGAGRGLDSLVYLTVGTGIGGGALVGGELLHGLQHPEMGHLRVGREVERDPFEGICPYHGDCLEGLASGPAIEARWGKRGEELPAEHEAWGLEAEYLAAAIWDITMVLSPHRVILGGGVMATKGLYTLVREKFGAIRGGYLEGCFGGREEEEFIVAPGLGDRSGLLGAFALAERALARERGCE